MVIQKEPTHTVPGHNDPLVGKEQTVEVLMNSNLTKHI